MSSKYPVTAETTADTVTIVSGRTRPATTLNPETLIRTPIRSAPVRLGAGAVGVVGGMTNLRSFTAVDLPTKQIEDTDFDTRPSVIYQSLTNLPGSIPPTHYTTVMGTTHKVNGERRPASSCNKCTVCVWFVVILALLLACGGVALGILHILKDSGSSESSVSSLETKPNAKIESMITELQANFSNTIETKNVEIQELSLQLVRVNQSVSSLETKLNAKIAKLESMITELQANFSNTIEVEIQELSLQLVRINQSVDGIITASTDDSSTTAQPVTASTVNLTTNCEYDTIQKCRISDMDLTPVGGATSDSYPNYSSCFTPSVHIDIGTGTFVQDVYCAVTNFRSERNPVIATLRHDQDSGTLSCYCFVMALETRRSVVDCSMFLKRCPLVARVN